MFGAGKRRLARRPGANLDTQLPNASAVKRQVADPQVMDQRPHVPLRAGSAVMPLSWAYSRDQHCETPPAVAVQLDEVICQLTWVGHRLSLRVAQRAALKAGRVRRVRAGAAPGDEQGDYEGDLGIVLLVSLRRTCVMAASTITVAMPVASRGTSDVRDTFSRRKPAWSDR